jgi:hypothetical protein
MRKLIKKILKESDDLQWIKDIKSHQDIAQDIADKTIFGYERISLSTPSFSNSSLTLLLAFLPIPSSPPTFLFKHCKDMYGIDADDVQYVWDEYRKIINDKIKNNDLNESNDLQWINDVKSHQDIAQDIADKTKIKNDLLHTPFYPTPLPPIHLLLPHSLLSSFTKYGKEQYGLDNEDDINDVWERYKKLVRDKVNNINESDENDLQWIEDVEPFVPFEDAIIDTRYNVTIVDDEEFIKAIDECGGDIDVSDIDHVVVTNRDSVSSENIYCDNYIHWEGRKDCLQLFFYNIQNELIEDHWFAPNHLVKLQYT